MRGLKRAYYSQCDKNGIVSTVSLPEFKEKCNYIQLAVTLANEQLPDDDI